MSFSGVQRWQWAKDMYDVPCGRYEENILSFIVHPTSEPHIHADIVPVVDGTPYLSKLAGNDKYEYRQKTFELHDALAKANEPRD